MKSFLNADWRAAWCIMALWLFSWIGWAAADKGSDFERRCEASFFACNVGMLAVKARRGEGGER